MAWLIFLYFVCFSIITCSCHGQSDTQDKTLIIQALPFLAKDNKCVVVVVANGLNAIIEEQQTRFGNSCVTINEKVINVLEKCQMCHHDDTAADDEDGCDVEDGDSSRNQTDVDSDFAKVSI